MDTIAIHCLWFLFGAASAFVAMFALAPVILSSRISASMRANGWEDDEPTPPTVIIQDDPQTLAKLAEAQSTNCFYQELYRDEMDRAKLK